MCVVRNGGVSRACRHCIDSRNALEPHMYTVAIRCSRDASIVDALSQTEQLEQAERPRNFRVAYMECARALPQLRRRRRVRGGEEQRAPLSWSPGSGRWTSEAWL